ncbi:uncharacterized protein LOC128551787 [Mercenaria mercenaria]|uniref:uncharacterized protein LOC128551787 n=1 Tax=Mercenaria mercenaria TaxID=6596 RepID=UPI00234EBF6A|nr:uncharacterized protein LOC128551787 [Mercenaria mercenaria]
MPLLGLRTSLSWSHPSFFPDTTTEENVESFHKRVKPTISKMRSKSFNLDDRDQTVSPDIPGRVYNASPDIELDENVPPDIPLGIYQPSANIEESVRRETPGRTGRDRQENRYQYNSVLMGFRKSLSLSPPSFPPDTTTEENVATIYERIEPKISRRKPKSLILGVLGRGHS